MIQNLISKKFPFKTSLSYYITSIGDNEIKNNDFKSPLLADYNEIRFILNQDIDNKMKFLYFNKKTIHQILYDEEETIKLNNNIVKNNISNYFYLLLLIADNPTLINYEYSIDFINNINKQLINDNKYLKNIILSKIIIELINNYKQLDYYDEDKEEEKLDKLKDNNLKNINNNLKELKDFEIQLDDIKKQKIDKLYSIIISIFINKINDNNYEYLKNILIELDLENISITKIMFEELSKIINEKKEYKMFSSENFKFTEEIINFYYILFKYILKDPIYIYNIYSLFESRKNFLNYIKRNSKIIFLDNFKDNNTKEKFQYICKFITDSNIYYYYINEAIQNDYSSTFETHNEESRLTTKNSNLLINQSFIPTINLIKNEDYFQIIHLEKIVKKKDNDKSNYETFIKEMSNEIILIGGPKDILYIYSKNLEFIKDIRFAIPSEYIKTGSKNKYKKKKLIKKHKI